MREKLDLYGKPFIKKEFLLQILKKFAPNYSITDLCNKWLLTPIKRGKRYINNKTKKFINPFVVWALYMWDNIYAFWWLRIYNQYGFSEQIAEWYTIYNTKISWKRIIWNIKFIFIRQRENFFYGIKTKRVDNYTYKVLSKERAFIQLLKEKKKFRSLPPTVNTKKLEQLSKKYTSTTLYTIIRQLCISKK